MKPSTSIAPGVIAPPSTAFVFGLGSLYGYLAKLTDRRKRRGVRYPLATILVLVTRSVAKLCGQDKSSAIADWVQQRRSFLIDAYG
jgi:DDE family transposase